MSPIEEPGPVHVVMCADHGFVVPLAVALASLDAASSRDLVRVHVLHPGFSEETRTRVTEAVGGLDVVWYEVDQATLADAHPTSFLSPATLYRLLLGSVLPAEVHRVIYLDADTVVLDSLAPLFRHDLAGHVLGAVRDAGSPWAAGWYGADWRGLGLDPGSPYLNAGILLIDLDRWRAEDAGESCLARLRRAPLRWGDQDALNLVFEGRWCELPRRWNVQTADLTGEAYGWALWRESVEEALAAPAVLHFTGRDKPWSAGTRHPRAEEWLRWLDKTPWAGWRPGPPRGAAVDEWAKRAYRSLREVRTRLTRGSLPR